MHAGSGGDQATEYREKRLPPWVSCHPRYSHVRPLSRRVRQKRMSSSSSVACPACTLLSSAMTFCMQVKSASVRTHSPADRTLHDVVRETCKGSLCTDKALLCFMAGREFRLTCLGLVPALHATCLYLVCMRVRLHSLTCKKR